MDITYQSGGSCVCFKAWFHLVAFNSSADIFALVQLGMKQERVNVREPDWVITSEISKPTTHHEIIPFNCNPAHHIIQKIYSYIVKHHQCFQPANHLPTSINICVYIYIYIYVYMDIWIYNIHMYIYIYTCVYIYIYTHDSPSQRRSEVSKVSKVPGSRAWNRAWAIMNTSSESRGVSWSVSPQWLAVPVCSKMVRMSFFRKKWVHIFLLVHKHDHDIFFVEPIMI